jgi:hypothetical protein
MQSDSMGRTHGKCPNCGKDVLVRSTRDTGTYCSRVCAAQARFKTRYRGTNSGPMDRPKTDKTKF